MAAISYIVLLQSNCASEAMLWKEHSQKALSWRDLSFASRAPWNTGKMAAGPRNRGRGSGYWPHISLGRQHRPHQWCNPIFQEYAISRKNALLISSKIFFLSVSVSLKVLSSIFYDQFTPSIFLLPWRALLDLRRIIGCNILFCFVLWQQIAILVN